MAGLILSQICKASNFNAFLMELARAAVPIVLMQD